MFCHSFTFKCKKVIHTTMSIFQCPCTSCLSHIYHSLACRGQVEILAPNWISIVELSFEGWCQLDRKIFQSAWIACGYMEWKDMPHGTQDPPITMEDARQVLDVFGKLGTGTPQWCTVYEWQIQDRLEIMIGLFWLFVCISTDGFF